MSLLSNLADKTLWTYSTLANGIESTNIENVKKNKTKQATEHGKQQLLASVRSNIARKASKQKQP